MRLASLVPLLALAGCATSLGAAHDGRVLDRGQVEVHVGTGILVPAGVITTVISDGKKVLDEVVKEASNGGKVEIHDDKARTAGAAIAAILVSPPSMITDLDVRYGVYDRLEVGLRKSGPSWRLEGWGQILKAEDNENGWNVAGSLGLSTGSFDSSLLDLLENLQLASFDRKDVDVAVLAGKNWEFGSVYFGPKIAYSSYSGSGLWINGNDITVVDAKTGQTSDLTFDLGHSWVYGGLVGGRLGWKYLYVTAELGVYGSSYKPQILGQEVDLGGLIVFPTIGVVGRY